MKQIYFFLAALAVMVCGNVSAADYALDLSAINATASGENNTCTYNSDGGYYELSIPGAWGMCAWELGSFDASAYDYLVVELAEVPTTGGCISIYNAESIWGTSASNTSLTAGETTIKVKLADCTIDGTALDKSKITIVGFQSWEDNFTLKVKSVYFTTIDASTEYFAWENVQDFYNSGNTTEENADGSLTITFGGSYAQAGWQYDEPIDISSYSNLKVVFGAALTAGLQFRLVDANGVEYSFSYNAGTESITLDLQNLEPTEGGENTLDLTQITKIYFWNWDAFSFTIESIELQTAADVASEYFLWDNWVDSFWEGTSMTITYDDNDSAATVSISGDYAQAGWEYDDPIDLTPFNYLNVIVGEGAEGVEIENMFQIRFVDTNNVEKQVEMKYTTGVSVDLTDTSTGIEDNYDTIDMSQIKRVYFWNAGGYTYVVQPLTLSDNATITGINTITTAKQTTSDNAIYSISGVRLSKLQKGINIVGGKKVIVK